MPLLSAFTPCGMLSFSSRPSHAQAIFTSLVQSQGQNYAAGGLQEARLYALARALARVKYTMQRAGNQQLALKTTEMLPVKEREYGVLPGPYDTLNDRRQALASRRLLPIGNNLEVVRQGLRTLLGSDYVDCYVNTGTISGEAGQVFDNPIWMPLPGTGDFRQFTLLDEIRVGNGSNVTFRYKNTDATQAQKDIVIGDFPIFIGQRHGQHEILQIVDMGTDSNGYKTATVSDPFYNHAAGAIFGFFPFMTGYSVSRFVHVIVTTACANNTTKVKRINDFMYAILPTGTAWDIASTTSGFVLGTNTLGTTWIL